MVTLKNPPYDSIWGSTTSLNYNEILKSTNSFDLFRKEWMGSFTSGTLTSTCTKEELRDAKSFSDSIDKDILKTIISKANKKINNTHLKSVKFNCENLWEEENA